MPWTSIQETSITEVLLLLVMKKNRSYEILVDASDAGRKGIFLSIAPPNRIETLSTGDQPPPRTPIVA
jgi:hypothetical protein